MGLPYRRPTLKRILAWAERAHEASECGDVHRRIFTLLDDERRARLGAIRALEGELAALLVRTPYALLLSFPGIDVVTAAEFAGEMGPIANSPHDNVITGRAGIFPARFQSDAVDRIGRLVNRANRALRYVILLIAENLLKCNESFQELAEARRAAGAGHRAVVVRAAERFCRIAYQMVAGRRVFRRPSCRERHHIIDNLIILYIVNVLPPDQTLRDLHEAIAWLPPAEYAAEAERLRTGLPPAPRSSTPPAPARPRPTAGPPKSLGRPRGPRPLGEILPEILLRLGVTMVESSASGEADPTGPRTADGPHNAS